MHYNFWEIYDKGTWLYEGLIDPSKPIQVPDQDKALQYFQRMSTALARRCGQVDVVISHGLSPVARDI